MRIALVCYNFDATTNTFVRQHAERLVGDVTVLAGGFPKRPTESFPRAFSASLPHVFRAAAFRRGPKRTMVTASFLNQLRCIQPDVVLAEYGPTAVLAMDACRALHIPLVAHFHGYDASRRTTLHKHRYSYRQIFAVASAVVGVSTDMCNRLVRLGANAETLHKIVYGIDLNRFSVRAPTADPKRFLAVGRFTAKKSPQTTLRAFSRVHRHDQDVRLTMVGSGPLLQECKDLAKQLGIDAQTEFTGALPNESIAEVMQNSGVFVQHSVEAPDGDREGTPVAILEASACGLPVVATRHAGIPEVVTDGVEGLLVDEHDETAMADAMKWMLDNPESAKAMGDAASDRVHQHFSSENSIGRLQSILEDVVNSRGDDQASP